MKIRGNTVGTPIKPEKNLIKATDLQPEEKAQACANIGAVSTETFENTMATVGARLNEVVAMRGDSNNVIYELECEGGFSVVIETNGFDAKITVGHNEPSVMSAGSIDIAIIPDNLVPMCDVTYKVNDKLTLTIADGFLKLRYTGVTTLDLTNFSTEFYYSLKNPYIPELADIRVAADGTTYPTAGEAVRSIQPGSGGEGYTPIRGVDYWTEEDKAEIVNDVLAALPDASEVDF